MEDDTSYPPALSRFSNNSKNASVTAVTSAADNEDEECDAEAWRILSRSFKEVQSVLDRNRGLIQQVNENHRSKVPENMAKNVSLIREINGNISKVVGLYSDLSVDISNVVHQRRLRIGESQ